MNRKDEVKRKLESLGASPKRSLGQNFLVSERAIASICEAVTDLKPKALIEIGPGLGALTEGLLSLGAPLRLVELDRKFSELWRARGVEVHEGDALRLDWRDFVRGPSVLVSNLPYQIAASLVIELSPHPQPLHAMVLMFQKEVAQRIVAQPGSKDYGFLSAVAQTFWTVRFVLEAAPGEFYPVPNVASRVLAFERRPPPVTEPEAFIAFVKASFAQRRKLLQKNLAQVGYRFAAWDDLAKELSFATQARAEELSAEQFVRLFERRLGAAGKMTESHVDKNRR